MNALVIYNPTAGWRKHHRFDKALAGLAARGINFTVRQTEKRGDAERFAREAGGEEFDSVIAAGGDGTINEVANGLGPDSPRLGVIPLGSANVFAIELGLPFKISEFADSLAGDTDASIFPGEIDGRRFVMMAGVGIDAKVVAAVTPAAKRRFGKLAYVWWSLVQFVRFSYPDYRVTIDGVVHHAISVIVANGKHYAGRFVCAPDAEVTEAGFHVCLFKSAGALNAMWYAAALILGFVHRLDDVEIVRGRKVRIDGPEGAPVQADGDIVASLPVVITAPTEGVRVAVKPAARTTADRR